MEKRYLRHAGKNYSKIFFALVLSPLLLAACNTHHQPAKDRLISSQDDKENLVFRQIASYSQVSDAYKGPAPLLKNTAGELAKVSQAAVSADGNWVVFVSSESLVPEAEFGVANVYIQEQPKDAGMAAGPVKLLSRRVINTLSSPCGDLWIGAEGANANSFAPTISADGRFVAFISEANNLAMNVDCETKSPKAISATGYSAQVYLADTQTGQITLVSGVDTPEGRHGSFWPLELDDTVSISGDGKIVAFPSRDSRLVNAGIPKKDGFNKGIFLYNSQTNQTSWVSFAGTSASPAMPDADSDQPMLNYYGNRLVFRSEAQLTPNDLTEKTVPDIYWAEFRSIPNLDIGQRTDLRLVSQDKDGFSKGRLGSAYPTISNDGEMIAFNSIRGESELVNNWIPQGKVYIDRKMTLQVFVRNMSTAKTSLISVKSFTDNTGNTTFDFTEEFADAYNPAISPDGKYIIFTSAADNLYLNEKMKQYRDGKLVQYYDGAILKTADNSCNNAIFNSNFATLDSGAYRAHTMEHKSYIDTFDKINNKWKSELVDGGWREALRSNCFPALEPDTHYSEQVYLVGIDVVQLKPVWLRPVSTSPKLLAHSVSGDLANDKVETLASGRNINVREFADFYQVMYGDNDSQVCSSQAVSLSAKSVVFCSAAKNLAGNKPSISIPAITGRAGDYSMSQEPQVGLYMIEPWEGEHYSPYYSFGLYYEGALDYQTAYYYSLANTLVKIEK